VPASTATALKLLYHVSTSASAVASTPASALTCVSELSIAVVTLAGNGYSFELDSAKPWNVDP